MLPASQPASGCCRWVLRSLVRARRRPCREAQAPSPARRAAALYAPASWLHAWRAQGRRRAPRRLCTYALTRPTLSAMPPPAPQTEAGAGWSNKQRRLGDFSVADEAGIAAPVEGVEYTKSQLFLTGEALPARRSCGPPPAARPACSLTVAAHIPCACAQLLALLSPQPDCSQPLAPPPGCPARPPPGVVYPKEGPTNKETGRRVEKFGPLESFSLDFSDKKGVQVGARVAHWRGGAAPAHARALAGLERGSQMCFIAQTAARNFTALCAPGHLLLMRALRHLAAAATGLRSMPAWPSPLLPGHRLHQGGAVPAHQARHCVQEGLRPAGGEGCHRL